MAKTHIIRFRLSREEFLKMKERANSLNKSSISSYLRFVALEQPLVYDKVVENNKLLKDLMNAEKR